MPPPRVGIASVQRQPPDLASWLRHHQNAGVSHVFLRLEGALSSHDQETLRRNADWVDVLETGDDADDTPHDVGKRQDAFVTSVVSDHALGCVDWLFHIDDDELLWSENPLPQLFDGLESTVNTVRVENVEAVLVDGSVELEKPFDDDTAVMFRTPVAAYGNGKAAGRVRPDNAAKGPHWFALENTHMVPQTSCVVLHFETLSRRAWRDKFRRRAKAKSIAPSPFEFYNMSIECARRGFGYGDNVFDIYRTVQGHVQVLNKPFSNLRFILFSGTADQSHSTPCAAPAPEATPDPIQRRHPAPPPPPSPHQPNLQPLVPPETSTTPETPASACVPWRSSKRSKQRMRWLASCKATTDLLRSSRQQADATAGETGAASAAVATRTTAG